MIGSSSSFGRWPRKKAHNLLISLFCSHIIIDKAMMTTSKKAEEVPKAISKKYSEDSSLEVTLMFNLKDCLGLSELCTSSKMGYAGNA
jgi:hypothetical protein